MGRPQTCDSHHMNYTHTGKQEKKCPLLTGEANKLTEQTTETVRWMNLG